MAEDGLCRVGHALGLDGRCPKCSAPKTACANGHDLTAEGATYVARNDGRKRCAECRRERKRRARQKAKQRKAMAHRRERDREERDETAREEQDRAALPVVPPAGVHVVGGVGPQTAGRYRLAVLVRRSRGLM